VSVCVSGKCIVAKRLIGSGYRLSGEWGRSRMGVLDRGGDRSSKGRGSFGGVFGASHCNQCGLCCVVVQERCAVRKLLWGGLVIL